MDRHTQTNGSDSITLTAYYICIRSHFVILRANFVHAQNLCMRACEIHAKLCLPGTMIICQTPKLNCQKSRFFDLVTLTYDLDHRTWPRCHEGSSPYRNLCPYVKRFSQVIAKLQTDTHTQTHGTDSITSDRCAGGNKYV